MCLYPCLSMFFIHVVITDMSVTTFPVYIVYIWRWVADYFKEILPSIHNILKRLRVVITTLCIKITRFLGSSYVSVLPHGRWNEKIITFFHYFVLVSEKRGILRFMRNVSVFTFESKQAKRYERMVCVSVVAV